MENEVIEFKQDQIRAPRLCIMRREEIGYGFNLHGEKGVVGQYISAVDPGGAADKAGLVYGDRVLEVNGVNVENCKHSEVVQHIRLHPTHAALLVIDQVSDKYLKSSGKSPTSDLSGLTNVNKADGGEDERDGVVDKLQDLHVGVNESPSSDVIESNESNKMEELEDEKVDDENPYEYVTQYSEVPTEISSLSTESTEAISEENTSPSKNMEEMSVTDELVSTDVNHDGVSVDSQVVCLKPVQGTESVIDEDDDDDDDDDMVEILPGVASENSTPLLIDTKNEYNTTCEEPKVKKIPPKVVPRRTEVKQGDWRAKKDLFDKL